MFLQFSIPFSIFDDNIKEPLSFFILTSLSVKKITYIDRVARGWVYQAYLDLKRRNQKHFYTQVQQTKVKSRVQIYRPRLNIIEHLNMTNSINMIRLRILPQTTRIINLNKHLPNQTLVSDILFVSFKITMNFDYFCTIIIIFYSLMNLSILREELDQKLVICM